MDDPTTTAIEGCLPATGSSTHVWIAIAIALVLGGAAIHVSLKERDFDS